MSSSPSDDFLHTQGDACTERLELECNHPGSPDQPFGRWVVSFCPANCDKTRAMCFCGEGTKYPYRPLAETCGFQFKLFQPDIIFVEKDSWVSGEDGHFNVWQLDWKQNGHLFKMPQMILLATNISNAEFDKAKSAGFSDTMIMKPLRASMVAACLQQVLGTGKKGQLGKDMSNGSTFGRSLLCGKKILVVDDNAVNRRVAAGALKIFGADVKCAESGKAALEMLQLPHNQQPFWDICLSSQE